MLFTNYFKLSIMKVVIVMKKYKKQIKIGLIVLFTVFFTAISDTAYDYISSQGDYYVYLDDDEKQFFVFVYDITATITQEEIDEIDELNRLHNVEML